MNQESDKFGSSPLLIKRFSQEEIMEARSTSFFTSNNASVEVRRKYLNTNQVLGRGAFGVVVLWKTRA